LFVFIFLLKLFIKSSQVRGNNEQGFEN